jgi:hypothetical protein
VTQGRQPALRARGLNGINGSIAEKLRRVKSTPHRGKGAAKAGLLIRLALIPTRVQ